MTKFNISSILRRCLIALLLATTFLRPQAVFAASLPAEINKQFTPLQIDAGGVSVMRVTIFNPNIFPLTNASWTDNLMLKTWKVKSGESTCLYFDGKVCK